MEKITRAKINEAVRAIEYVQATDYPSAIKGAVEEFEYGFAALAGRCPVSEIRAQYDDLADDDTTEIEVLAQAIVDCASSRMISRACKKGGRRYGDQFATASFVPVMK